MRASAEYRGTASESYWPGVADSLLAALMIVMLLSFGGLVLFHLNPNRNESEVNRLRHLVASLQEREKVIVAENAKLKEELEKLRPRPEPPIIELTDAQNVNFTSGKSDISPQFLKQLEAQEFVRLRQIIDEYAVVDTIEIIGHTDDTQLKHPNSNLDAKLKFGVGETVSAESLTAGSNADLGLMRALAVRQEWDRWLSKTGQYLPRPIDVRCYSAANTILPNVDRNAPKELKEEKARRIEIRFTHLQKSGP